MLAISVEFLSGRYVATAYNDRDAAEWPPHPARLFSALVSSWAEGEPTSPDGEAEIAALRWLEVQPAPLVLACAPEDAGTRSVVPVFVPVNDVGVIQAPDTERLVTARATATSAGDPKAKAKADKDVTRLETKLTADTAKAIAAPAKPSTSDLTAAVQLFPDRRLRQPRTFPSITPVVPRVGFFWDVAMPTPAHRMAMERLLARLTRLGHSASMVHARLVDEAELESLRSGLTVFAADEDHGTLVLRWVSSGQFDRLVEAFHRHREVEPRVLPAVFLRYRQGDARELRVPVRSEIGEDWHVFARVSGPVLPMTATASVAKQFRRALMSFAEEPIPEFISGHRVDGPKSERAHLAVVPLPFVASEHADGGIRGVALVLPRDTPPEDRAALRHAIARFEVADPSSNDPRVSLHLGSAGSLGFQRVVWGEHGSVALRPSTWTGPARHWASATPVALDQNPGDLNHGDIIRRKDAFDAAAASIAAAVERLGLPRPREIDVVRSSVLAGSTKPRAFPRFPIDAARAQRVLVHVRLVFEDAVRGPILIGAGRYQGLGLFRPLAEGEVAQ